MRFRDRSGQGIGQAEVERERRCDSPIIRDERAIDLPTAARDSTVIRLVVNSTAARIAKQEIGLHIATR